MASDETSKTHLPNVAQNGPAGRKIYFSMQFALGHDTPYPWSEVTSTPYFRRNLKPADFQVEMHIRLEGGRSAAAGAAEINA